MNHRNLKFKNEKYAIIEVYILNKKYLKKKIKKKNIIHSVLDKEMV